jgi:peptidoglycan/xylan/chitin deacetylase (PgdA/CDA1 family)
MLKKYFFAFLYYFGLTRLAAWLNRKQVMILCYHCVTPRPDLISADPWKMFLGADCFTAQLDFLKKNYNVISLREYLEARRTGRRLPPYSVVLTFDVGKRNFLTVIAPLLHKFQLPATTFVVVGNTDKAHFVNGSQNPQGWKPEDDRNDLSWEDIERLLKDEKIEVGSHTLTHPSLSEISREEAEGELKISYENVLARTRSRNAAIAYPYGLASEEIRRLAENAGYSCGLTNTDAGNDFETNLFDLNRTVINSDDDLHLFAARLAGLTWRLKQLKTFLRLSKLKNGLRSEKEVKTNKDFAKNISF